MGIRGRFQILWLLVLILFIFYDLTHARVNSSCDSIKDQRENHPSTLAKFFYCEKNGSKKVGKCPDKTIFDKDSKECTSNYSKKRSKRNSFVIVGLPCQENIDCLTVDGGAFCDTTKRCDCLPTHVNIAGFCWRKINPGETGCQYQEQCNSVWPGAFCTAGGVCNCPDSQPPHRTKDGSVCVGQGRCPTNGFNSKHKGPDGQESPCILPDRCALTEYDCFCSPPVPPAAGCTSTTYCCPSRALACIMPKEEGIFSGGTTQNKWYFNSATGNCESLAYRGDGGNANNFDSKGQCESYCKTSCPRGRPRYGDPDMTDPLLRPSPLACATTSASTCGSSEDYFCNTASTSVTSYCCPSVKNICGPRGGVEPGMTASVPDSGEQGFRLPSRQRYYYDQTTAACKSFTFNGQGGNYNNFDTEAQCKQYCSRSLCVAGEPLKDTSQSSIRCGSAGSGFCPSKYECSNDGYCCPTRDFVCSQPQAVGGCVNYVSRWWFNPDTRSCVSFTYSGCQGNFNNFGTYDECQSYCGSSSAAPKCPQGQGAKDFNGAYIVCAGTSTSVASCPAGYFCYYDENRYGCCPTKTQTCEFDSSDSGTPCVTPVSRWYYNSQARSCDTFTYNGCDGNSNNFATKIDCQDYCGVGGCPEGGEPYRESANGQYRACASGGSECPAGYACSQVTLGTSTVYTYCCPTRDTICRLPQDQGQSCGTGNLNRYYFNSVTRTCEVFVYRGCAGNRNNFPSIEQCLSYCNSAGCAAGQVALQDLTTRRLTTCSLTSGSAGCPTAYNCVGSTLLGQNICCGSNAPGGTCPMGQAAYMDSFSNSPQQCQQNTDANCPTGYFCQYSATQLNSFCCGSAIVQCPRGGTVNLNSFGQPEQCTPNAPNNCSPGFECQPITVVIVNITSTTGYCCGTPNPCGQGYSTQFRQNVAVNCDPIISNVCQKPYACMRSMGGQGYCCVSVTSGTSVCAIGKSPYLVQSAPIVCTSGGVHAGTGCPIGFNCDLYAPTNTFYCCGTSNTTMSPRQLRCPPGYAVLEPEQPCGTSPDTCPGGNFCSFDPVNKRYICCGKSSVVKPIEIYRTEVSLCPAGQPLPGIVCSINAQCPTGYMCKPGVSSNVCCPSPSSTCSLNLAAGNLCSNVTAMPKYYYNPASRSCHTFTYQGCGGNDNNFASQQLCEDFCMPSLCNRGSPQYFTGQSIQSCSAPGQCQQGYECSPPVFGGGSSLCCPSRSTICNSHADSGKQCTSKSSSPVMRWHYNDMTKSCQQFSFHGCHGNGNNFDTQSECMSFCVPPTTTTMSPPPTPPPPPPPPQTQPPPPPSVEVCPHSLTAQINPLNNFPQLCNLGVGATGCSNGYSCTYSPTERNYYCCGSGFAASSGSSFGGSNGCPVGAAYLYPLTKTPLSCSQTGSVCPSGYTCLQSTTFPGFLCCSVSAAHHNIHDAVDDKETKTVKVSLKLPCTSDSYCEEQMKSKNAFCNDKKVCSCSGKEILKNGICVVIEKQATSPN